MNKILFASLVLLSLLSCKEKKSSESEVPEVLEVPNEENAKTLAVSEFVASLNDDVKISQLFLVNIEGNKKFYPVEKTSDGKPLVPGGCILFSYNIADTPALLSDFTKSIRDFYISNQNIPPYIAVDQEGGDVNRLRKITSKLPSQKWISDNFSEEKVSEIYSLQAKQMQELGINMNLAPVVEVENESNKAFLDTRTFGSLEKVLSCSKNAVLSYEQNGIGTVLKHFPGNSSTDPHTGLPEIKTTKSLLENEYLEPFRKTLPFSSALLMSHARISVSDDAQYNSDSKIPSCLSRFWVTEIVRNKFGFEGLILSDDIFMGALAENGFPPEKAAVQAIEAGIDVIMLSEKKFGSVAKLLLEKSKTDENFAKLIDSAVARVIRYKIKSGLLSLEKNESAETLKYSVSVNNNYKSFSQEEFEKSYINGMEICK